MMRKLFDFTSLLMMALVMMLSMNACSSSSDDDDDSGDSATIVGEWTKEFSGSKGNGIQVLTFNSDGTGSWREISNEKHGYYEWQYNDRFSYTYNDKVLKVNWGDDIEYIDVISITSSKLKLKEWGDEKSVTYDRMTEEMRKRINNLQK
ncbi:MAG: hypothetical protein IJL82_04065 [Prevotella sp.]|nr:hypothetical protein [Prevotella sp.]